MLTLSANKLISSWYEIVGIVFTINFSVSLKYTSRSLFSWRKNKNMRQFGVVHEI